MWQARGKANPSGFPQGVPILMGEGTWEQPSPYRAEGRPFGGESTSNGGDWVRKELLQKVEVRNRNGGKALAWIAQRRELKAHSPDQADQRAPKDLAWPTSVPCLGLPAPALRELIQQRAKAQIQTPWCSTNAWQWHSARELQEIGDSLPPGELREGLTKMMQGSILRGGCQGSDWVKWKVKGCKYQKIRRGPFVEVLDCQPERPGQEESTELRQGRTRWLRIHPLSMRQQEFGASGDGK